MVRRFVAEFAGDARWARCARFVRGAGVAWLGAALMLFVGAERAGIADDANRLPYAIAIHGGAGLEPDKLDEAGRRQQTEALTRAIQRGRDILAQGGSALDAVEQTIRILEDEPLYNAGRGAVFNNQGKHELDAAIMDGKLRKAGSVAGVTTVRNPISLARLVMTETSHVLLMGDGAEKFADEMRDRPQLQRVPNSFFSTEHRRREWLEAVQKERQQGAADKSEKPGKSEKTGKGTVGCVALDQQGNLAAGTSTGGLTNKKWGRVGAVPIIGAGTFADNRTCAVSGTGTGELFLLNSAAFQIHALMQHRSLSLEQATQQIIDEVMPADSGGIIAVDRHGRITMRCNTPGMARAALDSTGKLDIRLER